MRKGETATVVLSNNGTCTSSTGGARLKVFQPAEACNTPGYSSCSTLLYSCGTNSPTITANAEGWFVFVADSDSVGEGTKYKLKVTLSNCVVAGCECP